LVLAWSLNGLAANAAPLSNANAALSQLAKDLADQSQPVSQRIEIVRALSGWASPQVVAALVGALKDPSEELRATAARGLGWPGNREGAPALRAVVAAPEETPLVKAGAVEALGLIGDPPDRALLTAATKHADVRVRQAALVGITFGPLTDQTNRIPYLLQLAEDQAFQGLLRCDAVRELSSVKEDRVVDAFIRILETEPRFALNLPEGGPAAQQQMMEIRRVQARDVAAWVAEGLGQLGAKRAAPLLRRTAEDKSDFFLRLTSLRALITLNDPENRPVLVRRLDDPVPDVRRLALAGLGELGDRTALEVVQARLTDANPMVRAQAATTLAMLGDPKVRSVLEDLQKRETDSNVLYAVDQALTQLPR
jgi:HEAT repeat protein